MRVRFLLASLVALLTLGVVARPAAAGPISLPPAAYSDAFQEKLAEDYGEREGDYLREAIERALVRALARVGGQVSASPGVRIETTIIDARPNRPTFRQLNDRPGLDFGRSISIGGAELHAVLRGSDGRVLAEVDHRFFEHDIRNVLALTTWGDARRSIDRFARKVAAAYAQVER
ncbi:MAG: DUF3313 family protein [Alphaproteobacteria bacterium]|nr:DUF3313 family protein [Alphaproteobacteria bacterium]